MDRGYNRRDALTLSLVGGSVALIGLAKGAEAAAGEPIPPISMTYYGDFPEVVEHFRKVAQDFREIGLTPKLEPLPATSVVSKLLSGQDFGQVGFVQWGGTPDRLDPNFWLEDMLSSTSRRNYGRYGNPAFDDLVRRQKAEMDLDRRKALVKEAQAVAAADFPVWWLNHHVTIGAYNKDLFGGIADIMGGGYGTLTSGWNYIHMVPLTARKMLRAGNTLDFTTMNPFASSTIYNQVFLRLIYDTFTTIAPDQSVQPWAAESWSWAAPTELRLKIRPGMTFHDGKPVTGEDVAFTFDYLMKWQFPLLKSVIDPIERVSVDGLDLTIQLKQPFAPFPSVCLSSLFILPRHIWSQVPATPGQNPAEFANREAVGSGPFSLRQWRRGQDATILANRKHFAAPKIDGVVFVVIPSSDGVSGAMERGEIDMNVQSLTPALADTLSALPQFKVGYIPSHTTYEMRPDTTKAPFSDVAFRRALYHAIDRRPIINYFAGRPILARNTGISPSLTEWHNPDLPAPEYDIAKARSLLKEAGYAPGPDGRLLMKPS